MSQSQAFQAAVPAAAPPAARRRRGRVEPSQWVLSAILIIVGAAMLTPVLWVVLQSFETPTEQTSVAPIWIPTSVTLHSYQTLLSSSPFALNIANSVLVTVAVVVGAAIVCVLAAYVFA